MDCANRVLLYLVFEKNLAIMFIDQVLNPRTVFLASSDAFYHNDPETRQSSQGYAISLFNGIDRLEGI